jgi:hypothetical protein
MTDKLVEAVAKAMCDGKWDAANFTETANGETPEEQRQYWIDKAVIAIDVIDEIENHPGVKKTFDDDCELVGNFDFLKGNLNWHGNGAQAEYARIKVLEKNGLLETIRVFNQQKFDAERAWVAKLGTGKQKKEFFLHVIPLSAESTGAPA